jgi:hypothetical protein
MTQEKEITGTLVQPNQVINYNVSDSAIAEMKANYLPMVINGVEDKEGYKAVVEARKSVKRIRLDVEEKRKELNKDALEYQRRVNAEAKRITGEIEPIEDHLSAQEKAIDAEKERIKQQKEQEEQIRYDLRLKKLLSIGFEWNGAMYQFRDHAMPMHSLKSCSDEEFISFIGMAENDWNLDQLIKAQKEAKQAEARRLEQESIEAEKARLKAIQEEQDRQARELQKERDAFLKMKAESDILFKQKTIAENVVKSTVVSELIQAQDFPMIKPVEVFNNSESIVNPIIEKMIEKVVENVTTGHSIIHEIKDDSSDLKSDHVQLTRFINELKMIDFPKMSRYENTFVIKQSECEIQKMIENLEALASNIKDNI